VVKQNQRQITLILPPTEEGVSSHEVSNPILDKSGFTSPEI